MHYAGIAIFLMAGSLSAPITRQAPLPTAQTMVTPGVLSPAPGVLPPAPGVAMIPEGPPVVSPDHAPPHPLKPRVTPEAPATGLARIVAALARGVLRDHGR